MSRLSTPTGLALGLLLLLALRCATAQAPRDEQWLSYRDAYRAMLPFEKYGQPRNFLQIHYRIVPRDGAATLEGLRLTLRGKTTHINLPLDETGRAVLPLLKSAYDDNAALILNRKLAAYDARPQVSIIGRVDGVYEVADLRAACDQALNFERYLNQFEARGRKCAGVRFVFVIGSGRADVRFRDAGTEHALPGDTGPAFAGGVAGDTAGGDHYPRATYRFAAWPDKGVVLSATPPLAITPLFD